MSNYPDDFKGVLPGEEPETLALEEAIEGLDGAVGFIVDAHDTMMRQLAWAYLVSAISEDCAHMLADAMRDSFVGNNERLDDELSDLTCEHVSLKDIASEIELLSFDAALAELKKGQVTA